MATGNHSLNSEPFLTHLSMTALHYSNTVVTFQPLVKLACSILSAVSCFQKVISIRDLVSYGIVNYLSKVSLVSACGK